MTLREADLEDLRGINERIDLDEVAAVYLPLTRLLNLYVSATQNLHKVSATFLGTLAPKVPYVIGVAGSVAVGKSTFARILQALLARWPDHPKVDLITTDGFLYPNHVLEERDLMNRKGFPESYDTRALLKFLRDLKSGQATVEAPVYTHEFSGVITWGTNLQDIESLKDQDVWLAHLGRLALNDVIHNVTVNGSFHCGLSAFEIPQKLQKCPCVVALGETFTVHQIAFFENMIGIEESIGRDEINFGVIGPARQKRLQNTRESTFADSDGASHANHIRHLGRQRPEKCRADLMQILGGGDI